MTAARLLGATPLVVALACALPVAVEVSPSAEGRPIRSLALAPLEAGSGVREAGAPGGRAAQVTGRLLEELTRAGFEVIPPEEVSLALASGGSSGRPLGPAEMARLLSRQFRIDALVTGRLLRYRPRTGGSRGAERPASVWFSVRVYDLSGQVLWQGDYDETQASVASRLDRFGLALSRRFEWLTADALIRYGAREIAVRLRRDLGTWS
ncbi:MAG: hypothetical protein ACE5IL_03580 [Myxococcota bacterium]